MTGLSVLKECQQFDTKPDHNRWTLCNIIYRVMQRIALENF